MSTWLRDYSGKKGFVVVDVYQYHSHIANMNDKTKGTAGMKGDIHKTPDNKRNDDSAIRRRYYCPTTTYQG
jgi:hypothetical protein